uniref:Uncharacterized protein n=1 Tax=Anguilla anguilla TaxID=7936 RepID=A0A0E9R2N5_ANGAN
MYSHVLLESRVLRFIYDRSEVTFSLTEPLLPSHTKETLVSTETHPNISQRH